MSETLIATTLAATTEAPHYALVGRMSDHIWPSTPTYSQSQRDVNPKLSHISVVRKPFHQSMLLRS